MPAFIGFGVITFRGQSKRLRILCWVIAPLVFAYIVSIALTRSPFPFHLSA